MRPVSGNQRVSSSSTEAEAQKVAAKKPEFENASVELDRKKRRLDPLDGLHLPARTRPDLVSQPHVMRLQAGVGNRAVMSLVAQRAGARAPLARRAIAHRPLHTARRAAPAQKRAAAKTPTAPAARGAVTTSGGAGAGGSWVGATTETTETLPEEKLGPGTIMSLQRKMAVGGSFAPPALPKTPNPKADPKFLKVHQGVKNAQGATKKHPPAKAEAKKAQDASVPPGNDKEGQAKAAQADKMAGAKKSGFDKAAFIAALTAALAKNKPQNLEQADEFAKSGKADALKNDVVGKVGEGKKTASQDMEAKAKEPPDPSVAKEKPVTPLAEEKETKPQAPDFAKGMPDKAPPEQTNLDGGKNETDAKMKEADVSEADLKKSNEPEMMGAVDAKKKGEEHSEKAPQEMRQAEAQTLKSAEVGASEKGKADINAMVAKKGAAKSQVAGKKGDTKAKDEAKRAEVTSNVNKIFDKTKVEAEKILTDLDGKVTKEFDLGEAEAKRLFTASHEAAMTRYKDKRYGGFGGGLLWLKDKVMGMPSEVNAFYETAKQLYVDKMTALAHRLADIIDSELTRAKVRVEEGRAEIKKYVTSLPKDLQKVGEEAAKAVEDKFAALESDVENKGQSLQEDLSSKYKEAMEKVNADIEKMQAENKGLWDSIKDAVAGAIKTILMLKDLFMGILAKAASAFKKVIADPIRFIGNFMKAVMQGFTNFASNILDHLKKGLKGWLFGKLAEGGIDVPETFDLKGIIKLVLQILGLTWANIRPRIVKVIGEKAMGVLETTAEVFVILVKEGPAGLIKWMMEKLDDLKEMVIGQIRNYVIEKIVKAGITWVLGMLNPAGALIKIIQALIAVVQWIMEKGEALAALINTVLDAVIDIADGGGGGVPAKIEQALSDAIPLVLSFLAGLLGLGGISEKIKSILEAVQKPVMKAVDFVIMGAIKLAGPIIRAAKGLGNKAKKKFDEGKAKVKAGANAGADFAKKKAQALATLVFQRFKLPPLSKPFTIGTESHTLTAKPSDSGVKWLVASAFAGELRPVLTKAKATASATDKVTIAKALAEIDKVKGADAEWSGKKKDKEKEINDRVDGWVKNPKHAARNWSTEQVAATKARLLEQERQKLYQPIEKELAGFVSTLSKIRSLDAYTTRTSVKQRRLPAGYKIRSMLYERGSSWGSKSEARRKADKQGIIKELGAIFQKHGGYTPEARVKVAKLHRQDKLPGDALDLFDDETLSKRHIEQTEYDLDHIVPLAKHWKTSGSKSGDQARRDHCVNDKNLNLITLEANRKKQAEGHHFTDKFYVEPSFSSEYADGGIRGAKRIDGQPLIDNETNEPLA